MTGVATRWIPLRESIGEEALRQTGEAFGADEILPGEYFGFVDSVPAHVAETYRRLEADENVGRVLTQLRRRGLTEWDIEILLRRTACLPSEWRLEDNEPWFQTFERRRRLAAHLNTCADSVCDDLELGGFFLSVGTLAFCKTPRQPDDREQLVGTATQGMAFSELLRLAASFLDVADGEQSAAQEWERNLRPNRSISLQSFVLRGIFEHLSPYFSGEGFGMNPKLRDKPRRAPNREVEVLASVALKTEIPPGTMTRLRKEKRRRYYRDKQ